MSLDGRVAVVTGAGRGIGRATALKLASAGSSVVVNDIDEAPALETVEAVKALGGQAVAVVGDVASPGMSDELVGAALDSFGDIHIVVNNAGYTWDGVIQRTLDEQWDAMIDVHLTAPFRLLRSVQPVFKRGGGDDDPRARKVVNISSLSGTGGNIGQVGYASGKAGVIGLTKVLAKEWGRFGATVNAVAFGLIRTRMTATPAGESATIRIHDRDLPVGIGADLLDTMERGIPLGRAGEPEDAANAIYLFCLPESDYITGQLVVCGGGMVL
jgi:3-oxoacyl-[acyl-carrier protein] reductase